MAESFGARLREKIRTRGHLCVGVDPHAYLLEAWGLTDDAAGAREFGLRVVDAAADQVGMVKPQVAFFERFGSAGYRALEDVLAAGRGAGLLMIADVKRGDVGSSVEAYGQAWLTPGSPVEADAMTISAFQGVGSIADPMDRASKFGKGLFVLAATSNPEAAVIQLARATESASTEVGTRSVARVIIDDVTQYNARRAAQHEPGAPASIGVVLGATLDLAEYGIDTATESANPMPVLAPGFGHQGAQYSQAAQIYGTLLPMTVISDSRSLLSAGPDGIVDAIARRTDEVGLAIG